MLKRIGVVLVASGVLIGLAAAPGSANSKTIRDETLPGIPTVDIKRATFGYAKRAVRARVFSTVGTDRKVCVAVAYGKKRARVRYSARACTSLSGGRSQRLTKVTPRGATRIKCPAMTTRWPSNPNGFVTKIKVPRRCTPKMGRHASHFRAVASSAGTVSDRTRRVKVRRG